MQQGHEQHDSPHLVLLDPRGVGGRVRQHGNDIEDEASSGKSVGKLRLG
jgi:hypothetical protein